MGFFGRFVYSDGHWSDVASGSTYLSVEAHDSDFAIVIYAPADPSRGRFYLGFQPRDYFEDPSASDPLDLDAEATGITMWAKRVLGADLEVEVVRTLLAEDGVIEPEDDFVEATVERMLKLLSLPVPAGFPESS